MIRTIRPWTVTAAMAISACSPNSGSGGGAGPTFDGGGLDATFPEDGGGDGGGSSLAQCLGGVAAGSPPAACTQLVTCVEGACSAALTAAFGPGWDAGALTGPCASFESCATQSACTEAAGVTCAMQTSATCQADVNAIVACVTQACPSQLQACTTSLLSGLTDGGVPTPPMDASAEGGEDAGMDTGSIDGGPCSCNTTSGCSGPADAGTHSTCPGGTICNFNVGECVSSRYTATGNGVVTDNVTGLVWQQDVPANPCPSDGTGGCYLADAQAYCAGLSLGGMSGWTLPTLPQLFSLVDVESFPTIDSATFPSTPTNIAFWSSSADGTGYAWVVSFSNGNNVGYSTSGAGGFTNSVRCVQ